VRVNQVAAALAVGAPPALMERDANPMPFDGTLAIDARGHAWGWGLDGTHDLCLPGLTYVRPHRIPLSDVTRATGARNALHISDRAAGHASGA
jgi:hypothetical protein